jgi:hypothetical protein
MFNSIRRFLGLVTRALRGTPPAQGLVALKASEVDRAIVADVMARSGVRHPDARVADRIAVAARTVITTVDEQAYLLEVLADKAPPDAPQRHAMDVELDRVRDELRDELVGAGARLTGAPAIGYEIMRRLRELDDRGAA